MRPWRLRPDGRAYEVRIGDETQGHVRRVAKGWAVDGVAYSTFATRDEAARALVAARRPDLDLGTPPRRIGRRSALGQLDLHAADLPESFRGDQVRGGEARRRRTALQLTLRDLGRAAGVAIGELSRAERGLRPLPSQVWERLEAVLELLERQAHRAVEVKISFDPALGPLFHRATPGENAP